MRYFIILIIVLSEIFAASLEVSLTSLKMNYEEINSNNRIIDSDKSKFYEMSGVRLKYRGNYFLNYYINFEYIYGKTTYSGATWNNLPLYVTQNNVYILNTSSAIFLFKNFYLSIGYRKWNRGVSDYSGDYNEIYKWNYIGYGYEYFVGFSKILIVMNLQYQKAFNASLKANLGEGVELELLDVNGWNFASNLIYKLKRDVFLDLSYKYQYWYIGGSNVYSMILNSKTIYVQEPESYTRNQYLGVGLLYKF